MIISKRSVTPAYFFGLSLTLGITTDILIRQDMLGINFFVWSLLWVVLLILAAYYKGRLTRSFVIFSSLTLINSFLVYVRAEPVVQFWSFVIALISMSQMMGVLYARDFLALWQVPHILHKECLDLIYN